jgi:hypothetical protein
MAALQELRLHEGSWRVAHPLSAFEALMPHPCGLRKGIGPPIAHPIGDADLR